MFFSHIALVWKVWEWSCEIGSYAFICCWFHRPLQKQRCLRNCVHLVSCHAAFYILRLLFENSSEASFLIDIKIITLIFLYANVFSLVLTFKGLKGQIWPVVCICWWSNGTYLSCDIKTLLKVFIVGRSDCCVWNASIGFLDCLKLIYNRIIHFKGHVRWLKSLWNVIALNYSTLQEAVLCLLSLKTSKLDRNIFKFSR